MMMNVVHGGKACIISRGPLYQIRIQHYIQSGLYQYHIIYVRTKRFANFIQKTRLYNITSV